tara:strand:+ start:2024 stop:2281 length:258 start_codon:yes stop_codon:yes gene_type:complete
MKNKLPNEASKEINYQMEIIFKLVESDVKDGGFIMLFALLNKAFSEIAGKPVLQDDLFSEEQHMAALKLLEEWLDKDNFIPRKIN